MNRLWNWVETLLTNMIDRRQKKAAKKLVKDLLPTTEELRDFSDKLELGGCAYTLASPKPPYDKFGNIAHRVAAKRAELGYEDDDGLVFTVPVINSHCDGEKTRLVTDIKNAKFKKFK